MRLDVTVCAGVQLGSPCWRMADPLKGDSVFNWYFIQTLQPCNRVHPLSSGLSIPLPTTQMLPIPDDPKKRNTSGCSSSYQPFSFLRIAAFEDNENKKEGGEAYKSMPQSKCNYH